MRNLQGIGFVLGVQVCLLVSLAAGYSGGDGSVESPYAISSVADWQALIVASTDPNDHFILTGDIDFGGATIFPVGWRYSDPNLPRSNTSFYGHFDGQGFSVRNAAIALAGKERVGLFSFLASGGQIRNLRIQGVSVVGNKAVGGLAGESFGTIINCHTSSTCTMTGSGLQQYYIGGLVGKSSGMIFSCFSDSAVSGVRFVGGLVGESSGTIFSCYATGLVRGDIVAGGLAGVNNKGKIIHCYSTGKPTGTFLVGGLCGNIVTGLGYEDTGNFWDTATSETTVSSMGAGKTTAQMKTLSTFTDAGWDIASAPYAGVWSMPEDGYPLLTGQSSPFISMPNVRGLSLEDAHSLLTSAGLTIQAIAEIYDPNISVGLVSGTIPAAGTLVYPERTPVTLLYAKHYRFSGGDGSALSPFRIGSVQDILEFAWSSYELDKHFVLTADIDLAGHVFSQAPIAPDMRTDNSFQGVPFTGVFDGGGHIISNLTITAAENWYLGLFGCVYPGGQITNVRIEKAAITGYKFVGGLVGYNLSGTVSNCYVDGQISGITHFIGGLVGNNESGLISNCMVSGSVSDGAYYVGGLVGLNVSGVISDCYSMSEVNGGKFVGGLVGMNGSYLIAPEISRSYSTGKTAGKEYVGGLCGYGGSIFASFWDIETSGRTFSSGGTGKTTAQMQTLSTFTDAGWDFVTVWQMPLQWYPVFAEQAVSVVPAPDVTGIPQAQAEATLQAAGLAYGSTTHHYDEFVEAGLVSRQLPVAGGSVLEGGTVSIVVSLGAGYSGGDGTALHPYKIASVSDFLTLSATPADWEKRFILTADLDLAGQSFSNAPVAPDTSPDTDFQGTPFNGVFDGGGHVISHLTITGSDNDYIGLFGYIGSDGQIMDLGVNEVNLHGLGCVGGLSGRNDGAITTCYSAGTVIGHSQVGGLAGQNFGLGSITNCYSTGSVSGTGSYVGGLIGNNSSTIWGCYAISSVSGNSSDVGGLIGFSDTVTVASSFWDIDASGRPTSSGGTGKTTSQMQTQTTFTAAGWDFVNVWAICEGTNYPRLRWQIPAGDWVCPDGVRVEDLNYLAERWLLDGCAAAGGCDGADLDGDGAVTMADMAIFARQWLVN